MGSYRRAWKLMAILSLLSEKRGQWLTSREIWETLDNPRLTKMSCAAHLRLLYLAHQVERERIDPKYHSYRYRAAGR